MEQIQNNRVITDLYRRTPSSPASRWMVRRLICAGSALWTADSLMASCRRGTRWCGSEISDGGEVLPPPSFSGSRRLHLVRLERVRPENWRILARCYRDGQWGEVLTVASGEACSSPPVHLAGQELHVIWTEQHKGQRAAAVLCP